MDADAADQRPPVLREAARERRVDVLVREVVGASVVRLRRTAARRSSRRRCPRARPKRARRKRARTDADEPSLSVREAATSTATQCVSASGSYPLKEGCLRARKLRFRAGGTPLRGQRPRAEPMGSYRCGKRLQWVRGRWRLRRPARVSPPPASAAAPALASGLDGTVADAATFGAPDQPGRRACSAGT